MAAWSNILGYTSLPGNTFTSVEAAQSPEDLAQLALSDYKGGKGYDPSNTNGTSMFPQGSTILLESSYICSDLYYGWSQSEQLSNCPSSETVNLCSDYTTCVNPKQGYPSIGSPSFNARIGLLASLVVIYSILAAYVIAVLPMGNGAAMKFYFPFDFSCKRRRDNPEGQDGVEAVNVSKSYGKVEALKPFSLTMKPSQVTAILGHNGAGQSQFFSVSRDYKTLTTYSLIFAATICVPGKSTFVNLLCCEQKPSSGDIKVQGHSVASSEKYAIRKMIGECSQDDILWPLLTAREHLELFGGHRGVSKEDMAHTVQRWLDSVDLDSVQHARVSSFSGGMKRRLSVALSTIGDVKVVVLDEPTTGTLPVNLKCQD
jgi:ABC-type Na+ transport system ATPase subunit NatA